MCKDSFIYCHTDVVSADQFTMLPHPLTDTGPASSNTDPVSQDVLQGSRWSDSP